MEVTADGADMLVMHETTVVGRVESAHETDFADLHRHALSHGPLHTAGDCNTRNVRIWFEGFPAAKSVPVTWINVENDATTLEEHPFWKRAVKQT